MKHLILLFVLLFSVSSLTFGQTSNANSGKIVVNASDLTPMQLEKIKNDAEVANLEKKLSTYGEWVGVGGEIGLAISEGLNSVVDVSTKFANTDVGKFTMIMIAYKIMGKDLVRIAFGILIFIIFTVYMFRYYKNSFTTLKISKQSNGIMFWLPKTYELKEPEHYEGYEFMRFLTIPILLGGYAVVYAIMFG